MIPTKEPIHTNNGSVFMLGEDGKKIKAISCELSAVSCKLLAVSCELKAEAYDFH